MDEAGEDFIITWHGSPVVRECEFYFKTSSTTSSMLCVNLQKINFPCHTDTTLTIINQAHDHGRYTVILHKHNLYLY